MSYDPDRLDDSAFRRETERLRRQFQAFEQEELALFAEHLPSSGTFLDIGCGPGFVTQAVKQAHPHLQVHGIDRSLRMISWARSQFTQIRWTVGDIYDLPYRDESIDFAYARLVFQHLEHPGRAARSVARVLVSGGKLVVVDVDDSKLSVSGAPAALHDLQQRFARHKQEQKADRYVGRNLGTILSSSGFVVDTAHRTFVAEGRQGVGGILQLAVLFKADLIEGGAAYRDELLAWLASDQAATSRAEMVIPVFVATRRGP